MWASRYPEVMRVLEKHGLDAIDRIAEVWGAQAEHLSDDLEQRERMTGQPEFAYGGKGDPDGRNLVLSTFQSVPEWGKFSKKNPKTGVAIKIEHEENRRDAVLLDSGSIK